MLYIKTICFALCIFTTFFACTYGQNNNNENIIYERTNGFWGVRIISSSQIELPCEAKVVDVYYDGNIKVIKIEKEKTGKWIVLAKKSACAFKYAETGDSCVFMPQPKRSEWDAILHITPGTIWEETEKNVTIQKILDKKGVVQTLR